MSEKVFKKGDHVKCVNPGNCTGLITGDVYTVSSIRDNASFPEENQIGLEGKPSYSGFYNYRFEFVAPPKTRAEEIAELETKLAALKVGVLIDAKKDAIENALTYWKDNINEGNVGAETYSKNVGPGVYVDIMVSFRR